MPQWLTREEAIDHCDIGASIWRWASTNEGEDPELILACAGDNLTLEAMAAADILRQEAPEWRVRLVNVIDLLGSRDSAKISAWIGRREIHEIVPA
jgi:xylulose-5-phosphate/fructose-6-phosphate phosphoketolase